MTASPDPNRDEQPPTVVGPYVTPRAGAGAPTKINPKPGDAPGDKDKGQEKKGGGLEIKGLGPPPPPASAPSDPGGVTVVRSPKISDLAPIPPSAATFGEYDLLEEIARGGMGVVYRARHRQLQRVVALKMILTGRLADDQEVKRFYNEAQAAAALQHPNIVAIHELGVVNDQHYFSMEYVEGESLKDLVARDALTVDEAALLVKTMAEAIQYAHERGVLHRDLKPQNVLVDTTGQPRVTDFGLAKQLDAKGGELTATGMVLGTPNYMAPEQAAGLNDMVGPASDVYGLGAVLFECLTGRPPFRAETLAATLVEVVENDPPAPRSLNSNVPRDLETICLKCLAKEPGRRYASSAALAADLDLYLRSEPITARPLSCVGRVLRWSRHKPFLALICGSTAVFMAFHILSLVALRKPDNTWFPWIATGIIVSWFLSGVAIERLLESDRWRQLGGYAFVTSSLILMTIGMQFDRGPSSAPIMLLYPGPGLAAILMPSVPLVWFATILAAICYLALALFAYWFSPENAVSGEQAAAFVVGLVVMGMVVHLLLRRVRITGIELSGVRSGSKSEAPAAPGGSSKGSRRSAPRASR